MNETNQIELENKICCAGHIESRNERCPGCTTDEKNRDCEDYCPTRLYVLNIPEKKGKQKNNDLAPCYKK